MGWWEVCFSFFFFFFKLGNESSNKQVSIFTTVFAFGGTRSGLGPVAEPTLFICPAPALAQIWRNEVASVEGKQCCYCCWWQFYLPTNIKTYFGTGNGLVRGNFCSMFGLGGFQIEIRLAFELQEAGRELCTAATDPKAWAISCSFHLGVVWLPSMWLCAANWGHWPAWVLGGSSAGHAVQGDGLSTKGINRLWIRSFWKVVLTRGLWDRESSPDAAGFICCQAPIIPRFLAASLGSFCYMGYFTDRAILPVSVGASLR